MKNKKYCKRCQAEKEMTEFYFQDKKRKDGSLYRYHNPECKECVRNKTKEWRKGKGDLVKGYCKNYYIKHREDRREYNRLMARVRLQSGRHAEWQRKNKDKIRKYSINRKIKEHSISKKEWNLCKEYFGNECAYCGITYKEHKNKYRQDLHKEHVDCEGSNDLSNCIPSCKSCNSSKSTSTLKEWYMMSEKFDSNRLNVINYWLFEDYIKYIEIK